MHRRVTLGAVAVLPAVLALGGDTVARATAPERRAGAQSDRLEPWQPVDPAFAGCSEGVCGRRGRNPQAVAQPGAKVGQTVYCPVSGAVFQVKESSPRAELDGKPLYLCCDACARHFAANRDRVLALRGLAGNGSSEK